MPTNLAQPHFNDDGAPSHLINYHRDQNTAPTLPMQYEHRGYGTQYPPYNQPDFPLGNSVNRTHLSSLMPAQLARPHFNDDGVPPHLINYHTHQNTGPALPYFGNRSGELRSIRQNPDTILASPLNNIHRAGMGLATTSPPMMYNHTSPQELRVGSGQGAYGAGLIERRDNDNGGMGDQSREVISESDFSGFSEEQLEDATLYVEKLNAQRGPK